MERQSRLERKVAKENSLMVQRYIKYSEHSNILHVGEPETPSSSVHFPIFYAPFKNIQQPFVSTHRLETVY